jgi:very-short-patch-repair endonuclease
MTKETSHRVNPEIRDRVRQMRRPLTPAEMKLWAHLRNRQLGGLKFRRQHPIGRFIADFYCAQHRLFIEIDGESHGEQAEYDAARSVWLSAHGFPCYAHNQYRRPFPT